MKEIIPLFPLNLVIFPGQETKLHIFEGRYKKLIKDCWNNNATFGIQPVVEEKVQNTGTEVEIVSIDNRYANGKMDITVKGKRIYRLLNYRESIKEEAYSNGVIAFLQNHTDSNEVVKNKLMTCLRQFERFLSKSNRFQRDMSNVATAYDLVNKVGLSTKKQYALLSTPSESERKKILLNHCRQQFAIEKQITALSDKVGEN